MAEENYIIFDIDRKRMLDKLAIFDAKAALIDEKSLNRLNRELREVQMWCGKILHGYIFTQWITFSMLENIIQNTQKAYEAASYKQAKYDA